MNLAQLKKLSYDMVSKCGRCGFCLVHCPTYLVRKKEAYSARGRNAITRFAVENKLELSKDAEDAIFTCLGCGACNAACLSGVTAKDVVMQNREHLVEQGLYPKVANKLAAMLKEARNISDDDQDERAEWLSLIKEFPAENFEKEKADVVFFVGCVASFFPMVQKVPANLAKIMKKAGIDFTILGGDEWCCGFPLVGAGMPGELEELKKHNVEKVLATGAKQVVFSCPSCYHTWKHLYNIEGVQLMHASQLIDKFIKDGKIKLKKPVAGVFTYHDPCDLGRNSGVYMEPRNIIKAIPGINFKELGMNQKFSECCGGGGNVEMVDPELSAAVAQRKLDSIKKVGADTVVTCCQQCVRTITTRIKRSGSDLKVKELTELVFESMED